MEADALILLTDVDGLYTMHPSKPEAKRIAVVEDIYALDVDTSGRGSQLGSGGMKTKLDSARVAGSAGIPTVLVKACHVAEAIAGCDVGTYFKPSGKKRPRRLLWLAHVSEIMGDVVLDAGAVRAVTKGKASLLPTGITAVHGEFYAGDPIDLLNIDGNVVARGFAHYDSDMIPHLMGRTTAEIVEEFGLDFDRPVVHRDDLVVIGNEA